MQTVAVQQYQFVTTPRMTGGAKYLTPQQIRDIVMAAIDGPEPLDTLLANALFGGTSNKPRYDRDWPDNARNAWYAATRIYMEERRRRNTPTYEDHERRPLHRERNPPTLEASWRAVLSFRDPMMMRDQVPGCTWPRLARLMSVSSRTASYHLTELGWRFDGKKSGRTIVEAPCRGCSRARPMSALTHDGYCASCRN